MLHRPALQEAQQEQHPKEGRHEHQHYPPCGDVGVHGLQQHVGDERLHQDKADHAPQDVRCRHHALMGNGGEAQLAKQKGKVAAEQEHPLQLPRPPAHDEVEVGEEPHQKVQNGEVGGHNHPPDQLVGTVVGRHRLVVLRNPE